ncbi:MAG: hypothetical protein PHO78_02865 [Methanomicrobium sp.]|nr:hypothetical protein [Methanomicrobium sp.]
MKSEHKEILILFISVMAGYLARRIYDVFPYSLFIMVITTIIVYYLIETVLKKYQ